MSRMLSVRGDEIVDASGTVVRLRGTCIGGWMNMEDFIAGYPGSEHGLRATMAEVLGESKARFFFESFLDHFFAEEDVAFIKSLGATAIRLPLNYRHFEDDMAPFVYRDDGFRRLDQALEWCARHGLYAILDLHAVQGWQNSDWHSDNANRQALLWHHRTFQDRFVALWEEFARRYRGNSTIAGYNVMNEPASNSPRGRFSDAYRPAWNTINALYRRVVDAIRAIDADHIIFLEGDYYSRLFSQLDAPFAPNLVYSSHNYNTAGFGPGRYPDKDDDTGWGRAYQERTLEAQEGTQFALTHRVPLWIGEFGAVYNGPPAERADRLRAMADQLDVFEGIGAHWTTWTYKDVGVMGIVELDPDSEYLRRLAPVLEAKRELASDFWMRWLPSTPAKQAVRDLARLIEHTIGDPDIDPIANEKYLNQAALAGYAATLMQPTYCKRFAGLSEVEMDRLLQSFAFANCRPHAALVDVLRERLALPAQHTAA
jgi:aryl-phospho-beta-D-glucosidase BglC (GH1 family)